MQEFLLFSGDMLMLSRKLSTASDLEQSMKDRCIFILVKSQVEPHLHRLAVLETVSATLKASSTLSTPTPAWNSWGFGSLPNSAFSGNAAQQLPLCHLSEREFSILRFICSCSCNCLSDPKYS